MNSIFGSMAPTTHINNLLKEIKRLMYGFNYEVCLGIDLFQGVTVADFERLVKEKYPGTNPKSYPLIPTDKESFLRDIQSNFDYRGDKHAGLTLTGEKEVKLKILQQQYFDYIKQFMNEQTKFYYYPDPEGLPGYPVFWEYSFVLFTDNDKIILLYGSSSD